MKIEELAALLKPKNNDPSKVKEGEVVEQAPLGPVTRQDRMLGPAPFSICFPHSPHQRHTQLAIEEALEGMDRESRFDTLTFDPSTRRFNKHTAHMGAVEL